MSSISALIWVFATTGFTVGFGHCIGMCGPIVVSFSLNLKEKRVFWPLALYNAGRITTYALLGGVMGLTGSFAAVTSHIAGIQKGAMIVAGLLIVIMGVWMGGWVPRNAIFGNGASLQGILSGGFKKLSLSKSTAAYYPLGLLLGLIPCGPVYTVLVASARAGMEAKTTLQGFASGVALMVAFGVGTLPSLLLVGKLAGLGWLKKRQIIYKIGAVVMILVGFYFVFRGVRY